MLTVLFCYLNIQTKKMSGALKYILFCSTFFAITIRYSYIVLYYDLSLLPL